MDYQKLVPYQRAIRPVMPDSFPRYVEQELDKIAVATSNIISALKDLNTRVEVLEGP